MASMTNTMLDSLETAQNEVKTTRDVATVSFYLHWLNLETMKLAQYILRTQEYVKVLAQELSKSEAHVDLVNTQLYRVAL